MQKVPRYCHVLFWSLMGVFSCTKHNDNEAASLFARMLRIHLGCSVTEVERARASGFRAWG